MNRRRAKLLDHLSMMGNEPSLIDEEWGRSSTPGDWDRLLLSNRDRILSMLIRCDEYGVKRGLCKIHTRIARAAHKVSDVPLHILEKSIGREVS